MAKSFFKISMKCLEETGKWILSSCDPISLIMFLMSKFQKYYSYGIGIYLWFFEHYYCLFLRYLLELEGSLLCHWFNDLISSSNKLLVSLSFTILLLSFDFRFLNTSMYKSKLLLTTSMLCAYLYISTKLLGACLLMTNPLLKLRLVTW